jgi:hypothetical protein
MPKALRWLAIMCFAFGLFLPLALVPAGGHYINGVAVTFAEFWRRGGGPVFFVAGIVFPLIGYGFIRARNWSRYLYVGIHVAWGISFLSGSPIDALVVLAWATLTGYYLFWRRNVREYFGVVDDASI